MEQEQKCVMVVDEALPIGFIANTTAILGATLGKLNPEGIGETTYDRENQPHLGIVTYPIPILKTNKERLIELRMTLCQPDFQEVTVVDFSDIAQTCSDYQLYMQRMRQTSLEQLHVYGVGLCGVKKKVNKLTGSLPLLR